MRERVSESGIHEYCVAWRHEAGGHAGFTWESSVNLYDRGLGGIVRRFESKAALGRMASQGEITRETYVWTAGQDGWKRAEDVAELARLFTILPPPPPGA